MTPSSYAREGAFGLLNKPLSRCDLDTALKRASLLCKKGESDRARRSISHVLSLDVTFSQRLIAVPKRANKKYPNSVLSGSRYEISPVWKVAPSTAWKKANRLSMLYGNIAKFGSRANLLHDLVQLATRVWLLSWRDFSGLCRKIDAKCIKVANLVGEAIYMPEPALRRALSAKPGSPPETVARSHLRRLEASKYDATHRPSTLGTAALLLTVKKRSK